MSNSKSQHEGSYSKFTLMMCISFVMMYIVMFLNVYEFEHIEHSLTRVYMTLLMVAPMAISKILFMWKMYPSTKANYSIIVGSALTFIIALYGLRQQKPINDVQWMKAMIPHHSSALLTSNRAKLTDPSVKQLAKEIIIAQEKEIAKMKEMISRLEKK